MPQSCEKEVDNGHQICNWLPPTLRIHFISCTSIVPPALDVATTHLPRLWWKTMYSLTGNPLGSGSAGREQSWDRVVIAL